MTEKERDYGSSYNSNFNQSGYLSQLNSKELVQSHIKSIMPSLKGGKKDNIHYLFVRVYKHLPQRMKPQTFSLEQSLYAQFGEYLNYKTFKDKSQLLEQRIQDDCLFYVFVNQNLASWAQKFSSQQRKESKGKKIIHVIKFLGEESYENKIKQRRKLKKDINEKIIYEVNKDKDCSQSMNTVIMDMQAKLTLKVKNQGDKVKNWALSNKYAHKKKDKKNLYFYIQDQLFDKLQKVKRGGQKRKKWVSYHSFSSYAQIIGSLVDRQDHYIYDQLGSQIHTSKLVPDKSLLQSNLKSQLNLNSSNIISSRIIPAGKGKNGSLPNDQNYIVCLEDFPQFSKLTRFVKSRDNWKVFKVGEDQQDKIKSQVEKIIKKQGQQDEEDQYEIQKQKAISARSLYIFTFQGDQRTISKFKNHDNNFCNMDLIIYESPEHLKQLLYSYSKDSQNYTIVIIDSTYIGIQMCISDFCTKNKNYQSKNIQSIENLHIIDKKSKYNSFNSFLGTTSHMNNQFEESAQWLERVMEERDKQFHPFNGLGGRSVYILYRFDKQYLIDQDFRKYIGSTRRLQKATYIDSSYLSQLLKTIKKNDSSIIITDDTCLRQAQDVAKNFYQVYIMNITNRKNVKDELKVLAWGPKQQIYNHIKSQIKDFQKQKKREYMLTQQEKAYERPDRQLPNNIQWKPANNICIRLSSKYSKYKNKYPQAYQQYQTMQNRLDNYFGEQIRFQQYDQPNQIRLTNRKQQPLTFIITDDGQDLNYMKDIAAQQVNDLRQQYILYSKNFNKNISDNQQKIKTLATKNKYRRFRFFSNNWKNIQQYIIGIYQNIKGFGNDSIYVDQEIHVFYHPQDYDYVQYYLRNFSNCPTFKQTNFHPLQDMEQIVSQQSHHHLYYLFVNERVGNMTQTQGRNLIESAQIKKWNKNVRMLIAKQDRLNKKQNDIKAIHEDGKLSMQFISKTQLLQTPILKSKPFIFYGKNNPNWYYFFDKYQQYVNARGGRKNRNYQHQYFSSNQELGKRLSSVRIENPGSKIWILVSDKKQLSQYTRIAKDIDKGRQIQFIYYGQLSSIQNNSKRDSIPIIFCDPNSKQIEAFIRNMFKRDKQVFSPAALRNPPPYIALSPQLQDKNFPLNKKQIKNWKEDLNAEVKNFSSTQQLINMSHQRPVYLIIDVSEQKNFQSMLSDAPNIRKIIYDSNLSNRKKSHKLTNFNDKKRTLYYGYYPAEIRKYLQYLRYNIKNSQQDLQQKFDKKLTQVYIEQGLQLTDEDKQKIQKKNASIVRMKRFSDLNSAIDQSQKYPHYNSLFIVKKGTDEKIQRHRYKDKIHYITIEDIRPYTTKSDDLVTDQNAQVVTYLKNLPQKRYDKAKKLQKELKLYYKKNMPQQNEIKLINKRNKNFIPIEYENIKQIKSPGVALVDQQDQKRIRNEGPKQQIQYFVLGNNDQRDLQPQDQYTYFITRNQKQLPGFLNNTQIKKIQQPSNKRPAINIPKFLKNNTHKQFSKPLSQLNYNYSIYRPLKSQSQGDQKKLNPIPRSIRDKITNDNSNVLNIPSIIIPDRSTNIQDLQRIRSIFGQEKPKILTPKIDYPPSFNENNFTTESDNYNFLQMPPAMPGKKTKFQKLAIIYPDNKQFNNISQTLRNNLDPKYFQVDLLPFKSDYQLQNYSKPNGQKIIAKYDKVICFLQPNHSKYQNSLRSIKTKFNNKLQYYIFQDDFDQYYPSMKRFLDNYVAKQQNTPYINKDDPQFWLSSTLYNVLVPFNKKKKFDSLKRQNVIVTPYKTTQDIFNQIHRQNQFSIIVAQYKDFNKLKIFPRLSPRCVLVVQDTYPIKEDQIVLNRFPKKVLYYGSDAYSYLNKFRIPSKVIPFKQQNMKMLFYFQNSLQQRLAAFHEQFQSFEKVPYVNNQQLFNYLIDRFKTSHNYRMKKITIRPTDLVRLYPKVFMQKLDYHEVYMKDYSQIGFHSIYKKNFKNDIHPKLYAHLPTKYYKNFKDLSRQLDNQDSPCLIITSASQQKMNKVIYQNRLKHLFIQLIDLKDKWIQENGDLTPFDKLARQELATKQILFTRMFSQEVFDTFNDMGYYYLSNKATFDQKRNIKFMTKQALQDHYYKQPNLLMIVFVQYTDLQHIPKPFYDPINHRMLDDRVKLIFLKSNFVHHDQVLYVKFNQIDPVIRHINKVQSSGRVDYCIYPSGELGTLVWHKFVQDPTVRGCESRQFFSLQQIDDIAKQIKGKFRKVYVICEAEDKNFIQGKLNEYSIKTKYNSNEEVKFIPIPIAEKKSFIKANSSIVKKSQMIKFPDQEDEYGQKFETVGHAIDIKLNSSNKPSSIGIEEVIQNKNFVLSVNEKLRNIFPIGNFYASKVKYFRNLKNLGKLEPGKSQIIISNQNLPEIQQITDKNPQTFVIYVNNDMPTGQSGNTLIIKEQQIPSLIKKLQGSKQNQGQSSLQDKLNLKNIQEYKTIKIVYDNDIDKQQKKKILQVSIKNKNIIPCLFKDMKQIKDFMRQDDSLVVLMMSKDPPFLEEEIANQNFMVVPKKRVKMLVPRQFDSAIDGLSTILQEQESQMQYIQEKELTQSNINIYLNMIQKNPDKSKRVLMTRNYSDNEEQQQKQSYREMMENDHQNITKLNVHSNIRPQNYLDEQQIYRIRQRLDGGVIVVVVQKKYTKQIKQILKNYNILIQQYSHAVNLDQSIRDRKDKVTIVVVQKNMLQSIIPIKKQFPRLIFILLNEVNQEVPEKYQNFISGQITMIPDIEKIIGQIHQENQKIKYADQTKGPSRFDNRRVSTVDVGNSERFSVGFNNTRAKKAFIFYKDPQNTNIKNRLSDTLTNITFISYKNPTDIQKKLSNYGAYQSILIANNQDIYEIQDYVSKKKQQIYIIRFDPPRQISANPKVKLLFMATSEEDLYTYLARQFHKNQLTSQRTLTSRLYNKKNIPEGKKYVQKYEPNTFGTTPRFPVDFVPPKSKQSTYSRRYLKSTAKTSRILKTEGRSIDSRSIENPYYH